MYGAKSFHKITHKKAEKLRAVGVGSVRTGELSAYIVYQIPLTIQRIEFNHAVLLQNA
jgi:hypothetical protein